MTRAGGGNELAVGRAAAEGAGSMALVASSNPPPNPMARMTNVVPTPTKNACVFDAIKVAPVTATNAPIWSSVPAQEK